MSVVPRGLYVGAAATHCHLSIVPLAGDGGGGGGMKPFRVRPVQPIGLTGLSFEHVPCERLGGRRGKGRPERQGVLRLQLCNDARERRLQISSLNSISNSIPPKEPACKYNLCTWPTLHTSTNTTCGANHSRTGLSAVRSMRCRSTQHAARNIETCEPAVSRQRCGRCLVQTYNKAPSGSSVRSGAGSVGRAGTPYRSRARLCEDHRSGGSGTARQAPSPHPHSTRPRPVVTSQSTTHPHNQRCCQESSGGITARGLPRPTRRLGSAGWEGGRRWW